MNTPKLIKWYAQNIDIKYDSESKLSFLPIGIANSQWPHGNLNTFEHILNNYDIPSMKTKLIYFSFIIETNPKDRTLCYQELKDKIQFLPAVSHYDNLKRMIEYKFCICPAGHGIDTHRLWEAYYFKIVPIMIESTFTEYLIQMNFPVLLLKSWNDLNIHKLPLYSSYDFSKVSSFLTMDHIRKSIIDIANSI